MDISSDFSVGLLIIMKSLVSKTVVPLTAWMMISDLPIGGIINLVRFFAFRNAMSDYGKLIHSLKFIYSSLHPLASLVMSVALLKSWRKSRVTWYGITYEMLSHEETVVFK